MTNIRIDSGNQLLMLKNVSKIVTLVRPDEPIKNS